MMQISWSRSLGPFQGLTSSWRPFDLDFVVLHVLRALSLFDSRKVDIRQANTITQAKTTTWAHTISWVNAILPPKILYRYSSLPECSIISTSGKKCWDISGKLSSGRWQLLTSSMKLWSKGTNWIALLKYISLHLKDGQRNVLALKK